MIIYFLCLHFQNHVLLFPKELRWRHVKLGQGTIMNWTVHYSSAIGADSTLSCCIFPHIFAMSFSLLNLSHTKAFHAMVNILVPNPCYCQRSVVVILTRERRIKKKRHILLKLKGKSVAQLYIYIIITLLLITDCLFIRSPHVSPVKEGMYFEIKFYMHHPKIYTFITHQ